MTSAKDEADARRLIHAGFSDHLVNMARRCSAWIIWHVPAAGPKRRILNNATVFFVDIGNGPLGITAAHVMRGLIEDKRSSPDLVCQIGDLLIDPTERAVDISDMIDLATFSVTPKEVERIQAVSHVDPGPWPPRTPQEGKGVFFVGFRLGAEKELDPAVPYPFDYWYGVGPLAGVYDNQLKLHFERQHWVHRSDRPEPPQNVDWGGVSGGPVFAVFENPVVFYQLVGVIKEYSASLEDMAIARVSKIQSNGQISA